MLSQQELLQICRVYDITCAFCSTKTSVHRLKRDMARPVKTEGDGHPLTWKWGRSGFDTIDPKQFFLGVCPTCGYTGELEDADFRQSGNNPDVFKNYFSDDAIQALVGAISTGTGIAQSLIQRIDENAPFTSALVKFHLAVYSHTLRREILPGVIARYYLRIAWLFRDKEAFYSDEIIEPFLQGLAELRPAWEQEIPEHKDYPVMPCITLDEVSALRVSRPYFERNFETMVSGGVEEELRLRYLLAEIGFRLYDLSDDSGDYKKAASFFSSTMQQCLGIISDKSVVGGLVNRAREMLDVVGERGRELRALRKSRGGTDEPEGGVSSGVTKKKKKKKKVATGGLKEVDVLPVEANSVVKKKDRANGPNGADSAAEIETENNLAARDKATRTISVLTEEVDALKGRIEDLEVDNKKWRQMIGKDALTGLPNKVALFRINLPKTLRSLLDGGTFSCIAIGLDQVGKVNQEHGWMMGDKMLRESAKGLRKLLQDDEELYRMDGANFVLVGKMSGDIARQRAIQMRRTLGGASVKVSQTSLPLTSSLGVVTIEQVAQSSVSETVSAVYRALLNALYRAKERGGNTVEVHNSTRF